MFKKTSDAVKTCIVFFIDFSSIFREKNRKKRAKRLNNGFARKKRRKFTFGTPFFSKKTCLGRFLGSLWVPGGLQGRSGSLPESFKIFINFPLRLKAWPDGSPGGSRKAPEHSQEPPGDNFRSIFGSILHVKKRRKL